MFGIGMPELILILAVALIVIGPKKLPDLAKSIGRALGEFKRATNDLKESIQKETGLDDVRASFKGVDQDLKSAWKDTDAAPAPDTAADQEDVPATDEALSSVKQAMDELNQQHSPSAEPDTQDPAVQEQPDSNPRKPTLHE
jgi:sec-independent protein translocase protein TatB